MNDVMIKEFDVVAYIKEQAKEENKQRKNLPLKGQEESFYALCERVKQAIKEKMEEEKNMDLYSEREKRAILGVQEEVSFFKDEIREYIEKWKVEDTFYPGWYKNLVDGIFHECWGYTCLAPWLEGDTEELRNSSSCKIIGDRVFFMIDGRLVLQPQRVPYKRRKQLQRALLMGNPKKQVEYNTKHHAEVYLVDGTRISLLGEGKTKPGQDSIVFRKYIVKDYSFERQAELGTIPYDAIPLFKSMVKTGFNVAFTGAVRTTKTTFLTTWQRHEKEELEGVMVETDPEIPMHVIMKDSPILQYVLDGEELREIIKPIMRSDADYIVMAEARDGIALYIAIKAANKGTRRVKLTYHTTDVLDFCYDVADDIRNKMGGSLYSNVLKVAKSFNFVFQFVQLKDKSKKRLKSIYAIDYDPRIGKIAMKPICLYDYREDTWRWQSGLFKSHEIVGYEEDPESYEQVLKYLNDLEEKYPMREEEKQIYYPDYSHLKGGI